MIIGFVGRNRVGKDTCADMLIDIGSQHNVQFDRYALADPIKDVARIMFNFTDDQLYGPEKDIIDPIWNIKPRDFFQKFGTEIMQFDIYKYLPQLEKTIPPREFWVQSLLDKIQKNNEYYGSCNVIITDVRGNHEARKIVENGGILIKITKPPNLPVPLPTYFKMSDDMSHEINHENISIPSENSAFIPYKQNNDNNTGDDNTSDDNNGNNNTRDNTNDNNTKSINTTTQHITQTEVDLINDEYISMTIYNSGTLKNLKDVMENTFFMLFDRLVTKL
jgi:hypothetical protein